MKRRAGIALVGLLACLGVAVPQAALSQAAAPPLAYAFRSWSTAEGLPQRTITGIAEDRDGYLWVATRAELSRFDGHRFLHADLRDSAGRGLDHVRALANDHAGDIWAARFAAGLSRLRPDGRLERSTASSPRQPKAIGLGGGDTLWLASENQLWRYIAGAWRPLTLPPGVKLSGISALLVDSIGGAWVGAATGLARVTGDTVRIWRMSQGLPSDRVRALAPRGRDGVWVATEHGMVGVSASGAVQPVQMDSGSRARVDAIAVDRTGRHWLAGADGVRLVRLHREADGTLTGHTLFTHPAGLDGATVTVLALDRGGRLWIGTDGAGLHQLRSLEVSRIRQHEGLPSRTVHEVMGDGADGLWIAGGCGGLVHWRADRIRVFHPPEMGLRVNCVQGLLRDRAGRLWTGQRGALARRDSAGHEQEWTLSGDAGADVGPLLEDRFGRVWFGTSAGQVGRIDAGGALTFPLRIAGLRDGRVWSMLEHPSGALWLGQIGAVSEVRGDSVRRRLDVDDGMPVGPLRALHLDADGGLWIASYGGGLARYTSKGGVRRLTARHGLFDDALSAIVRDSADRLWLLGDRGLAVAPRRELVAALAEQRAPYRSVVFGPSDSMPEGNGGFPNAWLDSRQRLWLASVDGVASVDAGGFSVDAAPVRPRIDGVTIDGAPVPPLDSVVVPATGNALAIAFTAPDLGGTDRLHLSYRLVGHDRAWIESGSERVARYARVRPGRYVFELASRSPEGVLTPEPVRLHVRFKARWWELGWVRALAVMLLVLVTWHSQRRIVARVRERNRILHAEIAERKRAQAEATQAASELAHVSRLATAGELATSIAHELNQPLTAMMTNAEAARTIVQLGAQEELPPVLDEIVEQAARAAGVVRSLRNFVRKQAPRLVDFDAEVLVGDTLRLLQPELASREVAVRTRHEGVAWMRGDPVQLQQVLMNLLLNAADAVRDLPSDRRTITLSTARAPSGDVLLSVQDEGPGISAEQFPRLFEPFHTTKQTGLGLGLSLSRSIVESHAGELTTAPSTGRGATFVVRLPGAPSVLP
jgi:signal transduction histidine kinase/ligand-binding sensor domain-containing protein